MVIIARLANKNDHRLILDDGSAIDILYLDAYKRLGLTDNELNPTTSLLYGFTVDHLISRGTAMLTMTVREHPRVLTVVAKFRVVDFPSAINGTIGRPPLKALKAVTSIY